MSIKHQDIKYIHDTFDLSVFEGKCILVTGATGLIGKAIISALLSWNMRALNPIKILALVRNGEKAKSFFLDDNNLQFIISDVCDLNIEYLGIDYIIHGASQTASNAFVQEPVETIMTTLKGTQNLLELAKLNSVKGFVYLSSMEVYGSPSTDEKITETHETNLNTMNVRACYPESKRMSENLCKSYASEYDVPAKVIRLTQTFGPGVQYNDGRVFAEFARCAIEGKNIILNTKGETKRSYLYIADAVKAILTVLIVGDVGEAYNAANEDTYCSIFEMASMVAKTCTNSRISVEINDENDTSKFGYAPQLKMNLDTSKLQKLGWVPKYNLEEMYNRMIIDMQEEFNT